MKLKTLALCAAVAGTWAHDADDGYDPFDNSDLGPVVSSGYQAELDYCENADNFKCRGKEFTQEVIDSCKAAIADGRAKMNAPLCNTSHGRSGGQIQRFVADKESGGFKLGKISIPSFRLSCKNSHFRKTLPLDKNEGFCGIILYEVGTCPLKVCRRLKNGYVIIVHREEYMHLPWHSEKRMNYAHNRAAKWFFGEFPIDLRRKYGMRFAGFSVRSDGTIGYGSSTFNRAGVAGGSDKDKDDNRNSNAYESAIIYMMSEIWKAKTEGIPKDKWVGGTTVDWEDATNYFRENMADIRESFQTYATRHGPTADVEEIPQEDVFQNEFKGQ